MITILASITGFIGSLIPEILKIFKDSMDKKHELRIFEKQIEFNKLERSRHFEEIQISKNISEQASLYATYHSGITWVDALNASVRPVLAYSFFCMYAGLKITQYMAISLVSPIVQYIDVIWSIDDQAIFAGIISFYFGQRTFSKFWKK